MTKEKDWADDQIANLKLSANGKSAVRNLLHTFWTARDMKNLSKQELNDVLSVFGRLAKGHSLTPSEPNPKEVWVQVKPGNIVMRQTVRVRSDAYQGEYGVGHNGRTGVVVGIRPDDIRVKYTDGKEPNPDYVRHRTSALEKRVR